MISYLFELPTSTEMLSQIGSWSKPIITDFWPLITMLLAFGIGIAIVILIPNLVAWIFRKITHKEI